MGTGKCQRCFSWDRNDGPETRMQGTRYISAELKTLFTKFMDFTGKGFIQPALVQLKRINLNHFWLQARTVHMFNYHKLTDG